MKVYVALKKVGMGMLLSMLPFSASCALGTGPVISPEPQQARSREGGPPFAAAASTEDDKKTSGATEGTPGMRVYIDPKTGEFTKPPPGVAPTEVSPSLKDALSTSSEGLVETPSPAPGGGVMIDLQGRFRSPLTATRDAEGKLKIQHQPRPSESSEKKE